MSAQITESLLDFPAVALLGPRQCGKTTLSRKIVASLPDWQPNFYRTTNGAEIDLVLSRARTRIGVECKAATAPTLSRGMRQALHDLGIDEAWIIAPVTEPYPVSQTCMVSPLAHFLQHQAQRS